jgi:small multidrug resistance pump
MLLPYYAGLFGAVILGAFGQLLLKTGAERSADIAQQLLDPSTIGGLLVYALSALLYLISLRKLPLSIAFPSVSLSYVAVAVASHLLWQEPLGWIRVGGMAFILLGVTVLNYGM